MTDSSKVKVIEKHPLALRWFHWIHFPLLMLMIFSGILIYWANRAYIPIDSDLSKSLGINNRLAEGMGWHFMLMWLFAINGFIYFLYLIFSGEWRYLVPKKDSFREAFQVLLYDFKISKTKPKIDGKFNAGQRIAYSFIILNGFFALLTGLAIYKPVQLGFITELLGGYEVSRFLHFAVMILFILFFIVHILQVAKAGWNNFRAMVAGYEIEKD